MPEPRPLQQEPDQVKWRFRYSLRTLFAVVTIACVAAFFYGRQPIAGMLQYRYDECLPQEEGVVAISFGEKNGAERNLVFILARVKLNDNNGPDKKFAQYPGPDNEVQFGVPSKKNEHRLGIAYGEMPINMRNWKLKIGNLAINPIQTPGQYNAVAANGNLIALQLTAQQQELIMTATGGTQRANLDQASRLEEIAPLLPLVEPKSIGNQ